MADWNALQYLKFDDERTRPARDLLARVPVSEARRVIDLGCGPGNSTQLLVERFPGAEISGLDSSPAMLRQARELLPGCRFSQADLATWMPEQGTDVLFANAVFQWLPDHPAILKRLVQTLPEGGALAVQMPDNLDEPSHTLMREVAATAPFSAKLAEASKARGSLPGVDAYYDLLKPFCRGVDIWHTFYNHPLAGPQAITEWVKSTGLRPFLTPLDEAEQTAFLADYTERLAKAYPPRVDGTSLLRFPRLFIVATR